MPRPLRVLLFSSLFPSSVRPIHGIFVETRLRELIKSGQVEAKVIAPVPWFPFKSKAFGEYSLYAKTPNFEHRNGLSVYHPRFLLAPKIGMDYAPGSMANAALPVARGLIENGFDFDLIDAHFYYPDGVAAGIVAKKLRKPFFVTARGTDLNLIPNFSRPRRMIQNTAREARGSIGVCQALMSKLESLGADVSKLHTLRNGVDLERFTPESRSEAREMLKLSDSKVILLSVGHLIERKGHHIAIEALAMLPTDTQLVIAGSGAELKNLRALSVRLGVKDRVRFVGSIPQSELKWWYSAANVLVLCSDREGWANVLLESMACGTPVIATNIWGTPEVVSVPAAGVLMNARSPVGLIRALETLFASPPSREETRAHAEKFSWAETREGQLKLFKDVLNSVAN
jgi:teichuronic acid biosynthesis glycosyltransferase TuaC